MIITTNTTTKEQAEALGYVSITTPYDECERDLFENALLTLKGTDHIVVLDRYKLPEIWRKKTDLKLLNVF